MPDATLVRLVERYNTQAGALRDRIVTTTGRLWAASPDYRDEAADLFVRRVAPLMSAARRRMAALTSAYLARYEHLVRGVARPPLGIPASVTAEETIRGVAETTVYRRPFITVWTELASGTRFDEAVAAGLRRARSIAATDLQLAKTHTSRYVLERTDSAVGYRRVLTGAESCGLCIVASTQRYRRGDLQPIHPGCDCGIAPIYADADPGQIIDPDRLEGVHERIQERFGVSDAGARDPIDYRTVLVTHQHGELGPVLGVRGQHFTGAAEI